MNNKWLVAHPLYVFGKLHCSKYCEIFLQFFIFLAKIIFTEINLAKNSFSTCNWIKFWKDIPNIAKCCQQIEFFIINLRKFCKKSLSKGNLLKPWKMAFRRTADTRRRSEEGRIAGGKTVARRIAGGSTVQKAEGKI